MVIEDLNQNKYQETKKSFYPADPVERMFSFLLDLTFLSPFISLVCAYHFQMILQDESQNFQSSLWISMLLTGAFTSICLQTLFLYFYESTPGQAFLSLKVKSVEVEKLTWGACFLRSIGFHISCVLFFVPFVESFTHRLGRCLHDRLSDTMVVQLEPPKLKYFSQTGVESLKKITFLTSFFVALVLLNVFSLDPFLPKADLAVQKVSVDQFVAQALLLKEFDAQKHLEMNERLWTAKNDQDRNLVHYYQFIFADDKVQRKLISQKICQKGDGLVCKLTKLNLDEEPKVQPADWKLEKMNLTEKVGLMREAALKKNFALAFQVHESLQKQKEVSLALKVWDVALFIQAQDQKTKSRNPASHDGSVSPVEVFKTSRGEL